jgi:hypothetical protein
MSQQVDEAKSEFEEREDACADHAQDEWKERYHFDATQTVVSLRCLDRSRKIGNDGAA